ncbi:conserved hypothetical protein [Frankia sp. Hr75.2]|nr:conserved hypothetical protein [Frankia sp. Hr75.2]
MKDQYSYQEFCDYVRRFNQEELLATVATVALALPGKVTEPGYIQTPPWALTNVVRASICHGNRYRSTSVKPGEIATACEMYMSPSDEEIEPLSTDPLSGFFVRTAYEQFSYQESNPFADMARPLCVFEDYSGRKKLKVVTKDALAELIGAPLPIAVGVAQMLHVSAAANNGYFDPAWMDQKNFAAVLDFLPRDKILGVVDSVFAHSMEEFKQQNTETTVSPILRRYQFNPLTARPLVRLQDGRLLAPVPQLIPRKLSPIELYYVGLKRWGSPYADEMGELFEDYLGRQLSLLPDVTVHPEITYRYKKNNVQSVDWIVVAPDLVILIEAKAGRVPAPARAADESAERDYYSKILGGAFRQINRACSAIREGVPEFDKIPTDRPVIGIVGTLDSWYMANSLPVRSFLPETDVPTLVSPITDIENLVTVGQRTPASKILAAILSDDERRTWDLNVALGDLYVDGDQNPLLRDAWGRLPFSSRPRNHAHA